MDNRTVIVRCQNRLIMVEKSTINGSLEGQGSKSNDKCVEFRIKSIYS